MGIRFSEKRHVRKSQESMKIGSSAGIVRAQCQDSGVLRTSLPGVAGFGAESWKRAKLLEASSARVRRRHMFFCSWC